MPKNLRFLILSVSAAIFAGYILMVNVRLKKEERLNSQLNSEKATLQAQAVEIQRKITELAVTLSQKEAYIRELSDGQALRQSLSNAQLTIEQLSKAMNKVNNETRALRDENLNLISRFQNTNKEFTRATEELKFARNELNNIERNQILPLKRKIEELSRDDSSGNQAALKKDLNKMQESYTSLSETNKSLEKKIKELQEEKFSIESRLSGVQKDIKGQDAPLGSLQDEIGKLSNSLLEKRNEINLLESELAQFNSLKFSQNRQIVQQQEMIRDFESSNKNLREQVTQLSQDLAKQKQAKDAKTSGPETILLYEKTRDQVKGLTEILVKKEMELDKARRDSLDAVEKMVGLQTRLAELEKTLSATRVNQDKIREVDSQRMTLQSRLNEAQESLNKKNEVIDSLQKNVDYLNQQITAKEQEKQAALLKLSQLEAAKSSSQDEVSKQKSHVAEVDLLYNSLKNQVSQLTNLLSQKESDLEQRRKEIVSLREEMVGLKTRSMNLDQELADARDRQKKTIDDLTAAVRLNAVLQERMGSVRGTSTDYPDSVARERQSAEELRRKVEVILAPQK